MSNDKSKLGKTLLWGSVTGLLYWGLFEYADEVIRLAHTTTDACVIAEANGTAYYNKPSAEACSAQGGTLIEGNALFVLVPILIAFAVSYVHGAFTGMFWDSLGLKAATKKQ